MPRYLILGASGLIGRRLLSHLGPGNSVGTYHRTPIADALRFDSTTDELSAVLERCRGIEFAVIAFAETKIDRCSSERIAAQALNVTATKRVIDELKIRGILPVFLSTDMVFDGERGNYREADTADPIVSYGRMKKEIEDYLEDKGHPYLCVRLPRVQSSDPNLSTDLSNWFRAINAGVRIDCAHDQKSSAIDLDDVATGLTALMDLRSNGLFQLAGPVGVSRVDLFNTLVQELGRFHSISPCMYACSIRDFTEFAEPRPLDISMNSQKFIAATGFKPRDIRETCRAFAEAVYSK